jgi:transposase
MKRLRVRPLHHKQVKKLRRLQRSGCAFVSRWATILRLSHQGRSVQEIASGMELHVQTVRERLRVFNQADRRTCWALFKPPRRPGCPPLYGLQVQHGLVDLLKQSPENFDIDSAVWRLQDLVTVAQRTGLVTGEAAATFSVETVRRLLRKAGYIYLSAKWWITSDDPHYAHKKARRDQILQWAQCDSSIIVIYQDESWFSGNPKPVGGYGQPGHDQDRAVDKLPHKLKGAWVLYAAYEALTGRVQRYYAPRCNQTHVRRQLEVLLAQYQAAGKRVLVVIWDNASWHKAKALRRWYCHYNQSAKREGLIRLLMVYLPSRSPWLNPLEPVFGQTKRRVVGRRAVPQPGKLKRKVERHFKQREKHLERERKKAGSKT